MTLFSKIAAGLLAGLAKAHGAGLQQTDIDGYAATIDKIAPLIDAGLPLLVEGVKEGPEAFEAARQKAPELYEALATFARAVRAQGSPDQDAPVEHDVAAVVAQAAGVGVPGWTSTESQAYWDRAQGSA